MIIWSGWGVLTIVIAVVVGGGATVLATSGLQALGADRLAGIGIAGGLGIAAAVNWWVGRSLNGRPGRE